MSVSIKANPNDNSGSIQINGVDAVTFDSTGITGGVTIPPPPVTLNGVETLTNKTLIDVKLTGQITEQTYQVIGTSIDLDPNNGTMQFWTLTGNSVVNPELQNGESLLIMVNPVTYNITWNDVVWKTDGGNAPTLISGVFSPIVIWRINAVIYGARIGDA